MLGRVISHTLMHARKTAAHNHPLKNTHTRTHTSLNERVVFDFSFVLVFAWFAW